MVPLPPGRLFLPWEFGVCLVIPLLSPLHILHSFKKCLTRYAHQVLPTEHGPWNGGTGRGFWRGCHVTEEGDVSHTCYVRSGCRQTREPSVPESGQVNAALRTLGLKPSDSCLEMHASSRATIFSPDQKLIRFLKPV